MGPGMTSRRFLDNQEIVPGGIWTHNPSVQPRFGIRVRCVTVEPDSWSGLIVLDGRIIYETEPTSTFEMAAATAEKRLYDRLARVIASDD